MEVLLLGIYSFFVWLFCIKLKWIPWTPVTQITAAIIPIIGLAVLILLLNANAPSSADVRVIKYVVQVIPQVRGRVIDVPAEGNHPMKKGDVLFRIDPTPYQLDVKALEAQLAAAEGSANELREQLKVAKGNTAAVRSQIDLTRLRVKQFEELTATGAGNRFDLEKAQADLASVEGQMASAIATEARAQAQLAAIVDGDLASVATIKANLAKAQWDLTQTVMYAPANGTAINVQLRPGSFVVGMPFAPAMSFVEDEFQVIALFQQNELFQVQPGDAAEIALPTHPGRIIKARVESIVWAQGQGQLAPSGMLPGTGPAPLPPGRFAVKLDIEPRDRELFLAAGAMGSAAIYTEHLEAIHIIRKVILRVGSYTNYLILKLH
ncbi:MAG: HlyD family secretion protein [Proteobacteria bacterium]|nr:MAG: HlyD family secretion protein [Pseudomonadota bacterium]MCL4778175.1 HlyD family secretion protein [Gammaproteobacteria bacterium]